MSCPISVKNTVTSGINSLYTARSSGVSTTELRCATTPQMRPTRSVKSVSGSTVLSQLAAFSGCRLIAAIWARASAIAVCMAGLMSSTRMAAKSGSCCRLSNMLFCMMGFRDVVENRFYQMGQIGWIARVEAA